jgi:hypothetical protein
MKAHALQYINPFLKINPWPEIDSEFKKIVCTSIVLIYIPEKQVDTLGYWQTQQDSIKNQRYLKFKNDSEIECISKVGALLINKIKNKKMIRNNNK